MALYPRGWSRWRPLWFSFRRSFLATSSNSFGRLHVRRGIWWGLRCFAKIFAQLTFHSSDTEMVLESSRSDRSWKIAKLLSKVSRQLLRIKHLGKPHRGFQAGQVLAHGPWVTIWLIENLQSRSTGISHVGSTITVNPILVVYGWIFVHPLPPFLSFYCNQIKLVKKSKFPLF